MTHINTNANKMRNNGTQLAQISKVEWIDALKVVTMALVILGHCVYLRIASRYGGTPYAGCTMDDPSPGYTALTTLSFFLYSFHMPLFMAISGMCFRFSMKKRMIRFKDVLKSKTKRLLVPFVLVSLLYVIPVKYAAGYFGHSQSVFADAIVGQLLLCGNSHLWYVVSLFEIFIVYYLIERFHLKKNWAFWFILITVSWVGRYLEGSLPLGLASAMKHLFFFAMGYNLVEWLDRYTPKRKIVPLLALCGAFVVQYGFSLCYSTSAAYRAMEYVVFTIIAVIGGGSVLFFVKHTLDFITRIPLYAAFKKYTYELYLYSDPLNYPLIAAAYVFVGTAAYTDSATALGLFLTRAIVTTAGAFLVIYLLNRIKRQRTTHSSTH